MAGNQIPAGKKEKEVLSMGGVHKETLGQGRGHHNFDYLPFSEPSVVLKLIKNRMRLDPSYGAKMYPSGVLAAEGGIIFIENIVNTFLDLDMIIEKAGLSRAQRAVTKLTMLGWTVGDIAQRYGVTDQTVRTH